MLVKALHFLLIALEVLAIFNLIIIVHELGHFLAGRWRGLVIDEFGVWFGKPLWRKKIGGVWYSLGSVPAGGFVKLPQMAPMETIEGESERPPEELPPVRPLDKIIVAFAGPLFSLLLALALGTVVWKIGRPTSQADMTTEIGEVIPAGPADLAGLKAGDKILTIDGKKVTRWSGPTNSVMWNIMSSEGERIDFLVERAGQQIHVLSGWTREQLAGWKRKPLRQVKIAGRFIPEVGGLDAKGPAAAAGVRVGDIVLEANGTPIFTLGTLYDLAGKSDGKPLALTLRRGTEMATATFTPGKLPLGKDADGKEQSAPDFGVEWGRLILEHPTPWRLVADSVDAMRNMVGALLSRKSDVKAQHFSGPIGIMNVYRRMLEAEEGWRMAIAFSVFFNVNLALLNMLPFPVLDGGHITLAIVEKIRRKPVNIRVLEIVQTGCAMALVAFMLFVSFFDVGDFFSGKRKVAPVKSESATGVKATQPTP